MSKHKLHTAIAYGDPADIGADVDVQITFEYTPGAPAQGPTYASGGKRPS